MPTINLFVIPVTRVTTVHEYTSEITVPSGLEPSPRRFAQASFSGGRGACQSPDFPTGSQGACAF